MCTFSIGNDDRYYLARLADPASCDERIRVLHKPQTLHELYSCFRNAAACVGMRYHSVLMQAMLNGNNFILNYTDPSTGKIPGFVEYIGGSEFYSARTIDLQGREKLNVSRVIDTLREGSRFVFHDECMRAKYLNFMKAAL